MKKVVLPFFAVLVSFVVTFPAVSFSKTYTCPCPCNCPATGSSSYDTGGISDTRNQPVDMNNAPVNFSAPSSSGQTGEYSAPSQPSKTTGGYSDLPSGWAEPVVIPQGAVRIEDLGSPYRGSPAQSKGAGHSPEPEMPNMEDSYKDDYQNESPPATKPPSRWDS
jgi:hypothetical protein